MVDGSSAGTDGWFPEFYDALRRIAEVRLNNERLGHTLYATALVNEAYLKLAPGRQ